VVDAGGHGVPNVQVHFLAPAGFVPSATFNNYYPYTDNTGVATATATANSTVGCYDVTLSVAGVSTTPSFSLCNVAPDHMTITGGNSQTTQVSTAFASPLQVTVYDGSNNPKSGVVVKFSAPTSGPAAGLSSSSATTNASGVAQVNATANATAGSYSVVASAAGVAPVSFSLTNSAPPGAAAQLQLDILTSPQSTTINSSFLWPLKVRVLDGSNVPVSGAIVSYTAGTDPSTGASAALASGTATTDGSGYAQVTATANGLVGSYSVVVSVQGSATVQPKIISLRNYAPLPHSIALVSGTPQTTSVNTVFGQTLRVQLTDSNGNPTPQVRVYFTAPATGPGAALSAMSTLTDANGIAEVSATASGTAGDYQVGAFVFMTTVEHPIFVTFHLTNNAPQPTPEVAVPTMNEWGMIIFLLCAGAGAMYHMRRRRA
jgi:Bacterial Ig-like domain (group 1)